MKTEVYNPSPLEVEMANIIESLEPQIAEKLNGNKIIKIDKNTTIDNPIIRIITEDKDGDSHEVVLKIIQKPDAML